MLPPRATEYDFSRFFARDFLTAGHIAQHLRQRANAEVVTGRQRVHRLYFATMAVFRGYFELT